MAHVAADRVKETTTTTGTGNLTLGGAVSGKFKTFGSRCANGDRVLYAVEHQGADEWETGIGTWTTGGVLVRDEVLESSNADALVSFSAGTKHVWLSPLAGKAEYANRLAVTPAATQNDYSPTGLARAMLLSIAPTATITVTGLAKGYEGRILRVRNDAADFLLILNDEDTASAAANRFDFRGAARFLFPGDELALMYDAAASRWKEISDGPGAYGLEGQPFHGAGWSVYDDFQCGLATSGNVGQLGWVLNVSGTGAAGAIVSTGATSTHKAIGEFQLATGTTTTGRSKLNLGNNGSCMNTLGAMAFVARVRVPTLSDGTNTYRATVGFGDGNGAGEHTDGIYWEYDSPTSANWRFVVAGAATRTKTSSGKAASTGYIYLGAFVNVAGTRADFFHSDNGRQYVVAGSTSDANLPTGTELFCPGILTIEKSAGTTDRQIVIDQYQAMGRFAKV